MKVFIYTGNAKREGSVLQYTVSQISQEILQRFGEETVISVYPNEKYGKIDYCDGCAACFYGEACHLNDDVEAIKKELEESDVVIFASPVYSHAVSGSFKSFIDRITHWAHYFNLAGKVGITITVCNSNGFEDVQKYLASTMMSLGCSVTNEIVLKTAIHSKPIINSVVRGEVRKLKRIIDQNEILIDDLQEEAFQNYKDLHLASDGIPFEREFWIKSGLIESKTYKDYFKNKSHIFK